MITSPNPKISIIMIDGSFRESFHSIRYFGDQTLPLEDYELLWIEFYGSVNPELQAEIAKFPNFRVITLGNVPETTYHAGYCFNRGITEARSELLVIPDADVVPERQFLETVWAEHQTNEKLAMYIHRYNEDQRDHREDWDLNHLRRTARITVISNYGSCLTVRKKWMLAINGYDQHPLWSSGDHGHGYNVYIRLRNSGLHILWHPELRLYHPWHANTSTPSDSYRIHTAITQYQGQKLIQKALQGIDPTQDSNVTAELEQLLPTISKPDDRSNVSPRLNRPRIRRIFRGLFTKCGGSVSHKQN